MRYVRPVVILSLLCLPLLFGGCRKDRARFFATLTLKVVIESLSGNGKQAAKRSGTKLVNKDEVLIDGEMGGLTGDYEFDLGEYGTVLGTAEIKGSKKAKIREDDNSSAHDVIEAAVLDRLGVDVDVQLAKIKYDGRQTTGGVKKIYNLNIKFEGVVATGEGAGAAIKGKLKLKGNFKENETP